ncbi:MAG TPA: penicillin acylase family protein, partial [Chloroflexaceae bacterium]|nr:penicillin acylase family protein [Chloroflexaceae bacterium]
GVLEEKTPGTSGAWGGGANAGAEAPRGRPPLEFAILGLQPEPWTIPDILVWPKVMALNLSGNWTSELLNAHAVAALGEERARAIAPRYPGEAAIAVPAGAAYTPTMGDEALRLAEEAARFTGDTGGPQGSNAWAVSGARTASGRPLLAGDPHLGLGLPGVWYAAHLEGGRYHVAGVTFPGVPGVVIGHTRQIAWSVTTAMTDTQDLYLERFHPDDPDRYAWRDGWREVETVREEIAVKGQREVTLLDVRLTHHGPLIDEVSGPAESPLARRRAEAPGPREGLALRWTALDPSPHSLRAVLRLNRAHDWASFRAALEDWDVAPQNFVYADAAGHIGYALGARLPVRARGDGQLPVPGWDGEHEWAGFIPPAELPASLDPPSGAVVSANNRIVGPDHPLHDQIHGEYANPYRAERIAQLLAATERHDARSFARIQNDVHSLPGLRLARLVEGLAPADPLERAARDLLAAWDGEVTADSAAAAVYDAVRHHLLRVAYAELGGLLGAQAAVGAFGGTPGSIYLDRALPQLLARAEAAPSSGYQDLWLGGGRAWAGVLGEALARAAAEALERMGPDPARWSYGRAHSLTLRHPLGAVAALAPIFNRGPWPTGGEMDTVNHHYIPRDPVAGPRYNGPSVRQIFDPGDWDSARIILPAGQSGHPASSHYADMAAAWRAGGYFPLLWTPEAVTRHTVATLTLEPGEAR